MKKKIYAAAFCVITILSAGTATVHADEILSKDEIISEIWEDRWFGDGDDGTEFPEASFNHHLIESWVNDNYSNNEDYDWSDIGRLKYQYGDYYSDLTGEWLYTDADGQWYITDPENDVVYHFSLSDGEWSMIDSNGNTVDSFKPFNSLEEDLKEPDSASSDDSENDSSDNKVIADNAEEAHQKASEWVESKNKIAVSEERVSAQEEPSEDTNSSRTSSAVPFIAGGMILVGGAAAAFYIKNKKD